MIVKNEAHVIARCLASVLPAIDAWAIVDTGSTDDTIGVIERFFAGKKPGKVVCLPWVDFGTNRTQALRLPTKNDYAFIIDADDVLQIDDEQAFCASLSTGADAYEMTIRGSGITWTRLHFVRASMPFRYDGAIHEHVECDEPFTRGRIVGAEYVVLGGGGRSADLVAKKEIELELLERDLAKNPQDARAAFYLAQTHYYAWDIPKAIAAYERVLELHGWTEERFIAALRLGELWNACGNWPKAQDFYLRAYGYNPQRAEPLHRIAKYYRERGGEGWAHMAYFFAERAAAIVPDPSGFLVEAETHEWKCLDELSLAAYYTGRYMESLNASEMLLGYRRVPASDQARIRDTMNFAKKAIPSVDKADTIPALPVAEASMAES